MTKDPMIIPAAAGSMAVRLWWELDGSTCPVVHVERRAIVAWQILGDGAFPRTAGTDLHEGRSVTLILHPDGQAEEPRAYTWPSLEAAVEAITIRAVQVAVGLGRNNSEA